jgi:NAD(P)-dependent dehydrogenase (short-subunit alcohol dehydrogenase family)
MAKFGGLDILVVNAAVPSTNRSLHEEPVESLDRIIATNIRGAFLVLQSGVRLMLASGGGSVIMIGSLGGLRPAPAAAAYGMSKAATHAMARHVAMEYARNGIRANVIAPGATDTPLLQHAGDEVREALAAAIPLGRIADPKQIASVALFLASDDASHITGQILGVDGGTSLGR